MTFVDIGDCNYPAISLTQEGVEIALSHPTDADEAHDNLLGRGIVAEQAARKEHGYGGGAGSELKGLAASDPTMLLHESSL
jgi:hypothetical protein